jgi:hypothetical protein
MEQIVSANPYGLTCEGANSKNISKKILRFSILASFGTALIFLGASILQITNESEPWNGDTLILTLSSLVENKNVKNQPIWTASSIAQVKHMFKGNPELLKQWVKLSGKGGEVLIARPIAKPRSHRFSDLDKDLQQLDSSIDQLTTSTKEDGSSSTWTPNLNSRAAFLMVNDLSSDWDAHTNYSSTPWEFCVGRDLSTRQIRECSDHLISAAGIKAHRDLEFDSKVRARK